MHSRFLPAAGRLIPTALVSAALLCACAEPAPPPAPPPKPVKVETAASGAAHAADSFVGTVRAHQRTELSFETPGRIAVLSVDVGDRVRAGQVLAQLDDAPARLRLARAQADLRAAVAALAERRTSLRQQEMLARDGIISPAALQASQASYQSAASQHDAAEAALAAARRDLALTRITAPFDGEIVARRTQPFVDVAAGQSIVQMESGRAIEVVAMLPTALAAPLRPGATAHASDGGAKLTLTLERISARSDDGALVQAVFRVKEASSAVRSGATVSVELPRQDAPALTLPAMALMPGAEADRATVFVVDNGVLRLRAVRIGERMLPGGRVGIDSGLRGDEKVVVAGTAFLHDAERVVALPALTSLKDVQP